MTIQEEFLNDLKELVNLEAGTSNPEGVSEAAAVMKRHFESIGFHAELVHLSDKVGRGLFATNKPEAKKFDVIFNAHLDTVFPKGEAARRPFAHDDKFCYGPGCVDCKGGVLSIYYALKYADKSDLDRLAIAVLLNPDEEIGSPYSRGWLTSYDARCALICEPARPKGEFVSARKGTGVLKVVFHGKSAHAGICPEKGCNAAVAAMRFALAAYELNDFKRGTTVNPGVVHLGKIMNSIPDEGTVVLDLRFWNDEDGKELDEKITALSKKVWVEGVTCELEKTAWVSAMPLSEKAKALDALISKASDMAGFQARFVSSGGASDGNKIAGRGIPVVDGCGPAGDFLHTEREYLEIATIVPHVKMLVHFLSLLEMSDKTNCAL